MPEYKQTKQHPGFRAAASRISHKQGVSMDSARAILASGTRGAGRAARHANPRLNRVQKSVTLGQSFASPIPMPFRDDGAPDWDAPTLGSYVSFLLENGPLKGRVVVLKRQQNGMYIIAEDDTKSKDNANREKDKAKLSKEEIISGQGQTEATKDDLDQLHELAESTQVSKSAAWTRKEGKNPRGGLNAEGRRSAKREGHNLKPPVKSNSGRSLADIKRRYSFLSRMSGNPGPERDANGKPTRLLLSLQVWGASSKADAKRKAAALKKRIERMEGAQKSMQQGTTMNERYDSNLVFRVQKSARIERQKHQEQALQKSRERAYEALQEMLKAERQASAMRPLSKAEIERRALKRLGVEVSEPVVRKSQVRPQVRQEVAPPPVRRARIVTPAPPPRASRELAQFENSYKEFMRKANKLV